MNMLNANREQKNLGDTIIFFNGVPAVSIGRLCPEEEDPIGSCCFPEKEGAYRDW